MNLPERIAQLEERMAAVEERPIPSGADKMDINAFALLEARLFQELGKENVLEMKEGTINTIKKSNLDCTPQILDDFSVT